MSETKKVNVPLLLLCGVFLVAVIVAITMAAQRNSLSAEVTELQQQIAEEQATWQAIAAEKEELQATLTETENALKEAFPGGSYRTQGGTGDGSGGANGLQ